ncbi:MAG TPA: sodium:solute symporter family protein [Clostridiales bacterium]|nr:sodium:solute symporter family protein [Clostridiales bacterium]
MISSKYTVLFVVGFFVYIALMILIAYVTSKKTSIEGEDYLMGGRNVSLPLLICTAAATAVGTGTSVGATANGFRNGWLGAVYPLANAIGLVTVALCFAVVRKHEFRTLAEELQFYYDGSPKMRKFMSVVLFIVSIIWVGSAINGGANYLAYLIGMNMITAKLITVLAFGVYVFIGGYMAVVWTDAIQTVLLFGGFVLIAIMAVPTAGGFEAINTAYTAAGNAGAMTAFGVGSQGVLGVLAVALASYYGAMAGPTAHMRVYTAQSTKTARKAILVAAVVVACFSILPALVGMSAFTLATNTGATAVLENPDFTFAYMATTVFPPAIGLICLIAGLSAIMFSADSDAIAGVTTFLTDVYVLVFKKSVKDKDIPKYSRGILVIILTAAFCMTIFATDIMSYISNVIGSLTPGIGVALLLGRFWKRATWQGGVATMTSGIIFGVCYLLIAPFNAWIVSIFAGPALPVTILTLVVGVVVSLMTPPSVHTEEERVALVMAERNQERSASVR